MLNNPFLQLTIMSTMEAAHKNSIKIFEGGFDVLYIIPRFISIIP